MTRAVSVRPEQAGDGTAIGDVVSRAFGRDDEARLVAQLRRDGDATLSLVALAGDAVIGHVLLSPMSAPFRALGLAPLSVVPERQKQGVGTALMNVAISQARQDGWSAIFVLGDPVYYGRFGFRADLAIGFLSPYAGPHFTVRPLVEALPATTGSVDYAPAFRAPA
ncbi:MAG: N-acetyltransferase [Xanthobacteraceae bacterium]|nr:N-acetyltransferase [Xanthobacteraceae bacterium]